LVGYHLGLIKTLLLPSLQQVPPESGPSQK
jgi:hypothetical protein